MSLAEGLATRGAWVVSEFLTSSDDGSFRVWTIGSGLVEREVDTKAEARHEKWTLVRTYLLYQI
jgi:hypothetical protein